MYVEIKEGLKRKPKKDERTIVLNQIEALLDDETDIIANMANIASLLYHSFDYFWVGFYILKENQLVLGPFQGPIACTRINLDKGVCGFAATTQMSVVVPDVDKFPGHIACSIESKSEIVIPCVVENKTIFVLDVDSKKLNFFNEKDQKFLEEVVRLLS